MISVAHRTKLFELMSALGAATSHQIAESGGLQERYVRECLGALVVGGIVEYNAKAKTYHLPPEHAAFLTRAAAPHNLAVLSQFLTVFGSVEDQLVECFHKGGGVPYSAYPRFQEIMVEMSDQTVVFSLIEAILPLVPDLTERLEKGIRVLDVGCGSGRALNTMAEQYPKSEFVGYDLSEDGIRAAQTEAKAKGLTNVTFKMQDVSVFDDTGAFDLVTAIDSIHDQIYPDKVLANIRRGEPQKFTECSRLTSRISSFISLTEH